MSSPSFAGWPAILGRLISGGDLSPEDASGALEEILSGDASAAQIAAFITALRVKGETVEEMAAFVRTMLDHAEPLHIPGDLVDTCGTGGDRRMTINVSTIAAIVTAGAGAKVCKHGGRAASSSTGSADLLEELGVVINLGPAGVKACVEEAGIGFCFAPRFHPAMRHAGPVRSELGVPTVFNLLGPLANPARARRQLVGVSDPTVAEKMLGVLAANGAERAMVVWSDDGLDELSTTSDSHAIVFDVSSGTSRLRIDGRELGLARATLADLRGGDASVNAGIAREVLAGKKGHHRDVVLLNAAAAILVSGLSSDLPGAMELASASLDEGRAASALDRLVEVSQSSVP